MGSPDLTKNVFRSVVSQLAILYDREPIIEHDDPVAAERMRDLCRGAGVWTQGPQLQRLVIGQREALRRVSWEDGRCSCASCPSTPSRHRPRRTHPRVPHTVIEYRRRELDGQKILTRDVLSVEGGVGVYRIESGGRQARPHLDFLGADYSGEAYPVPRRGRLAGASLRDDARPRQRVSLFDSLPGQRACRGVAQSVGPLVVLVAYCVRL